MIFEDALGQLIIEYQHEGVDALIDAMDLYIADLELRRDRGEGASVPTPSKPLSS